MTSCQVPCRSTRSCRSPNKILRVKTKRNPSLDRHLLKRIAKAQRTARKIDGYIWQSKVNARQDVDYKSRWTSFNLKSKRRPNRTSLNPNHPQHKTATHLKQRHYKQRIGSDEVNLRKENCHYQPRSPQTTSDGQRKFSERTLTAYWIDDSGASTGGGVVEVTNEWDWTAVPTTARCYEGTESTEDKWSYWADRS